MREVSDHKEASVYLAEMSADPRVSGNQTEPPDITVQLPGAGEGEEIERRLSIVDHEGSSSRPSSGLLESKATENAKSAFEITSVVPYDELEVSMSHPKSDTDSFLEVTQLRGQSESELEDTVRAEQSNIIEKLVSDSSEKIESAANGPVVAAPPKRFRRVIVYTRGRWTVEDTLEKEERVESEPRGVGQASSKTLVHLTSNAAQDLSHKGGAGLDGGQSNEEMSNLHSHSGSELLHSERESHMDRCSVAGEATCTSNISRNTSLSSLTTAGDKSVDGDHMGEQLSQVRDTESESEAPVLVPPPAPPSTSTSIQLSDNTTSFNISSSDTGEEDSQQDSKAQKKSTGEHRVQTALSHLSEELTRMLAENKEIVQLKGEKKKLKDAYEEMKTELNSCKNEMVQLRKELNWVTHEKRRLEDTNRELSVHISQLKQELNQMAAAPSSQPGPSDSS